MVAKTIWTMDHSYHSAFDCYSVYLPLLSGLRNWKRRYENRKTVDSSFALPFVRNECVGGDENWYLPLSLEWNLARFLLKWVEADSFYRCPLLVDVVQQTFDVPNPVLGNIKQKGWSFCKCSVIWGYSACQTFLFEKKKTKLQPTFPFPICILLFSLRSLDVADPKPASSLRLRSMSAFCFCWYRIWKMCFVCEKWKVLLDDQKMVVSNNYTNDGKNVTIMLSNYLWFVGKKMFHLLIIDMKWDWSCWTRDKVSSYYTNEVMWQQLGKCKCWTSNWIKLIVVLE